MLSAAPWNVRSDGTSNPQDTTVYYLRGLDTLLVEIHPDNTLLYCQSPAWSIRNNIFYDLSGTPNIGFEIPITGHSSLGANLGFKHWDRFFPWQKPSDYSEGGPAAGTLHGYTSDSKWRNLVLAPEYRFYIDTINTGLFLGADLLYTHYNTGAVKFPLGMYKSVRGQRVQGDFFGLGLFAGMANDAAAFIIHRDSCDYRKITMEIEGLADTFFVRDSVFSYDLHTLVYADYIDATPFVEDAQGWSTGISGADDVRFSTKAGDFVHDPMYDTWTRVPAIFCGVGFPSKDEGQGKTIDGIDEPVLWVAHIYVTLSDGTTTKNSVYIGDRLPAGSLLIYRGWLRGDGSFVPGPPGGGGEKGLVAGVSVTLDWKQGPHFDPEL